MADRMAVEEAAIAVIAAARVWLEREDELNAIAGEGLVVDPRYLPAAQAQLQATEKFRAALAHYDAVRGRLAPSAVRGTD